MEWFSLVLTIIISCVLALYCIKKWLKRRRIINMLALIPGPRAYPILGSTLSLIIDREDIMPVSTSLMAEFGPICAAWTISFTVCLIAKAEYVERILSSTEETTKSQPYEFFEPWLGTGLLTASGKKWYSHRKLLTSSFHFTVLESFIDIFNEKSKILENKLRSFSSGTEFNMYPLITLCTLDIICEAVMGVNMNTQVDSQNNEKSEYISGIYKVTEGLAYRIFRPWLYPKWIFYNLSSQGKNYVTAIKQLHNFSNKVVNDKIASRKLANGHTAPNVEPDLGTKKKQAFLDLLLEASEKEEIMTSTEVREEVDTFMFEGHDTTTAAVCWAVFLLGNHPEVQDKVYEELDCIFQGEQRKIKSADLKEMKYLERVIKETVRLYPSVPFFDRALKNDTQFGEYVVPAGVDVRISAYHLHRSPENFENPSVFDPDNFLPEKVRNRHPFAYIPFSAGPRNCIGQKFAMMELKAILATIFLNFRIESVEKVEEIRPMCDVILRPKSGLRTKLYPRSRNL